MTVTAPPRTVAPAPVTAGRPPSSRGYWIGGFVTAAAVMGAIVWVVVAFFDYQHQIDRFPRMTVPGVATVQVTDTSTRVLFYESARGAVTPALSQLGVTVNDPTGAPVSVAPYPHELRYDVPGENSQVGLAVAEFHPNQAGAYQVRSGATAGVTGTIAVGGDIVWDIAPHAVGAAALFLVGGGAGVALLVVTGVRRANARRAAPVR